MNKFISEETVPVLTGTRCDKCLNTISLGVFQGNLSNGKLVYFCQGCHLECKLHPIRSKLSFK